MDQNTKYDRPYNERTNRPRVVAASFFSPFLQVNGLNSLLNILLLFIELHIRAGTPYNSAIPHNMVLRILILVKSRVGLKCDTLSDWGG